MVLQLQFPCFFFLPSICQESEEVGDVGDGLLRLLGNRLLLDAEEYGGVETFETVFQFGCFDVTAT